MNSKDNGSRGLGLFFYFALFSGIFSLFTAGFKYFWLKSFSLTGGMSPAEYVTTCEIAPSSFLIFSANVYEPLIYYSHLLALLAAAFFAILLAIKSHGNLSAKRLVAVATVVALWAFSNLVVWATPSWRYCSTGML
jgi:hypothetical protein